MRGPAVLLSCLLALACGCSGERDPGDLVGPTGGGTIAVDGRLLVGQGVPPIIVSTTLSPDRPFDLDNAVLQGAHVIVYTADGDTMVYEEAIRHYRPSLPNRPSATYVRPGTTYFLRVEAPDGRLVTAQTTTPDSFSVREWLLLDETTLAVRERLGSRFEYVVRPDSVNQLVYQDGLVEARFERGTALAFQMALWNLETDSPLIIDADFLDEDDLDDLDRRSSSPPLDAPDGYVRLPWLAVWFEGRHQFAVYSIDRNWYDIARSIRFYGPSGIGFGSNAGDDFERPIFHVQGGIGLFGSASVDYTFLTISPKP